MSLGEGPEHREMQEKLPSHCLSSLIPACQSPQPPTEAIESYRVLPGGRRGTMDGGRDSYLPLLPHPSLFHSDLKSHGSPAHPTTETQGAFLRLSIHHPPGSSRDCMEMAIFLYRLDQQYG